MYCRGLESKQIIYFWDGGCPGNQQGQVAEHHSRMRWWNLTEEGMKAIIEGYIRQKVGVAAIIDIVIVWVLLW